MVNYMVIMNEATRKTECDTLQVAKVDALLIQMFNRVMDWFRNAC